MDVLKQFQGGLDERSRMVPVELVGRTKAPQHTHGTYSCRAGSVHAWQR